MAAEEKYRYPGILVHPPSQSLSAGLFCKCDQLLKSPLGKNLETTEIEKHRGLCFYWRRIVQIETNNPSSA